MSGNWQYTPPAAAYAYARPYVRNGRVATSRTEIINILIAAAVITVDIAIISIRAFDLAGVGAAFNSVVVAALAFGAAAALTCFVFHELGHKVAAQRRGYWAEFRMSPMGLFISFITALIGFLFAAPGATVVQGMSDRREWGWTSLAGPTTNLVEGVAFFSAALYFFRFAGNSVLFFDLVLLAFWNAWFATFNLIPVGPLDGRKVLNWSVGIWVVSFALAATFAAYTFALVYGYTAL